MAKLEIGQVVWTKHPRHNIEWPAKIMMKAQKDNWQVIFFSADSQKQVVTVAESTCKPFQRWNIDNRESPIILYDAYKLAHKDYLARKAPKDTSEEVTEDSPQAWGVKQLKNFLNEMVSWSAQGQLLAEMSGEHVHFEPRQQDKRAYLRERFCQKLDYLINERELNRDLVSALMLIRERMKALLMEAFLKGELL